MKKNISENAGRRQFIGTTASLVAGSALIPASLFSSPAIIRHFNKPNSIIKGVQIGTITYSYRSMPDQDAESVLKYVLDSGISAIELMGDPAEDFAGRPTNPVDRRAFYGFMRKQRSGEELTEEEKTEMAELRAQSEAYNQKLAKWRSGVSMDSFAKLKKMYNEAGVSIYGFKPSTFGKNNSDVEIDYGFRAAKALGASHVTLEHPSDDDHTMKLGKMAKKHKVYVAYHGHEQQTPTFWDTALAQSPYNALNIDIGHYVAAGNTKPLEILRAKHDRIMSMHLKDRETPENGKKNMPWGEGNTPIVDVLRLMRDQKYAFPGTIELEYEIPAGSDAVKQVAICLEYCKRTLEA